MMQPSSSTSGTIVSAKNQNDATIVKDKFFFCHYNIVWESNNASDARGQSWNESLKSIWIPGGSCGYTSGTKRKHFAALSSPRPWWRWLQLQPSCGSPQCKWIGLYTEFDWKAQCSFLLSMFGEILIQINMTYFTNISCICYTIVCVSAPYDVWTLSSHHKYIKIYFMKKIDRA